MLQSLSIRNVVLIDQLLIEFRPGLCALTGETGAGKSILLDSLGLALGERSESGLLRKGADQASVIAEFVLPDNAAVPAFLKEQGVEAQSPLILRRMLDSNGRSRAFINDQPVSVSLLKTTGEMLTEYHGQFETHGLLNTRTHRSLLDDYAGLGCDLGTLARLWDEWKEKEESLSRIGAEMEKARSDEDYLRQSVEDLDTLDPKAGEEEHLGALRERLMKREQIFESLNAAHASLTEAEGALGSGWRALERIGGEAQDLLSGMDRASAEMQEVLAGIRSLSADLESSEYSLEEIDDRLFALKGQARKHGCSIDDLPSKREELAAALNRIEHQDDVLADLMQACEKARRTYEEKAQGIGEKRRRAAEKLDALVAHELPPLKLDRARFVTGIESLPENQWGPLGTDRVQFLVATNPGSEPGPLGKIASGGEMARFMLALKVVLAEVGVAGTLVFDEVDSGIGGATADAVGERLARLAEHRQILVVTHSPQVAARAGSHYIVMKGGQDEVKSTVLHLEDTGLRREEIARMLAGATVTEEARAAAEKLLESAA